MTPVIDPVGNEGLHFFGRTTASATHELKNALAIIRENAGLLKDYMAMADQGKPVDPGRMKTAAGRIEDQVSRADNLLKSLNQYAHSVDDHSKEIDLNTLLTIFETLLLRPAVMKQVTLQCVPAATSATVCTAPFFLLAAMENCLSLALTMSGPGETIRVGISAPPAKAIQFQLPGSFTASSQESFPDEPQTELLTRIGATMEIIPALGRITIHLKEG